MDPCWGRLTWRWWSSCEYVQIHDTQFAYALVYIPPYLIVLQTTLGSSHTPPLDGIV